MAEVPKLAIAALGVGGLSLLLHVIGMATDYWVVQPQGHGGLWEACIEQLGLVACVAYDTSNLPARFSAARAMEVMGVLAGGAGVLLILLRLFQPSLAQNRHLRWLPLVSFLVAGIFGLVGVLLFCDPMDACKDYAGWSFILTIIGSCIHIIGAAPLAWKVSYSTEYQRI